MGQKITDPTITYLCINPTTTCSEMSYAKTSKMKDLKKADSFKKSKLV